MVIAITVVIGVEGFLAYRVWTARQKMYIKLALYNWFLLPPSTNDIAQADADLAASQANLAQAQANYDDLKNGRAAQIWRLPKLTWWTASAPLLS